MTPSTSDSVDLALMLVALVLAWERTASEAALTGCARAPKLGSLTVTPILVSMEVRKSGEAARARLTKAVVPVATLLMGRAGTDDNVRCQCATRYDLILVLFQKKKTPTRLQPGCLRL